MQGDISTDKQMELHPRGELWRHNDLSTADVSIQLQDYFVYTRTTADRVLSTRRQRHWKCINVTYAQLVWLW